MLDLVGKRLKGRAGGTRVALFAMLCAFCSVSAASDSKVVTLASSEGPPHIIDGPSRGIDLDIAEVILNAMGYEVNYKFMSLARGAREVKAGRIGGVLPTFAQKDEESFYVSEPFIDYKPMVFSLREFGRSPQHLSDLSGESIATFQGAPGYFGPEFVKLSLTDGYHEIHDMSLIPEMLWRRRVDFAVLDLYIFYYFYRLQDKSRPLDLFTQHDLIAPVQAGIAFSSRSIRDEFNRQLAIALTPALKQRIVEKYLGEVERN